MTAGMWSAPRKRRYSGLPVVRPRLVFNVVVMFETPYLRSENQQIQRLVSVQPPWANQKWALGLVFAVKQVADAGFVKHRRQGIGEDFGYR